MSGSEHDHHHHHHGSSSSSSSHARVTSVGRRLYTKPRMWRDWHEEEQEVQASYWELFTDLLLVAAASAVAEVLEEEQNWKGLFQFAYLYIIIVNGWLLYTHHFTARFHESSLLHSGLLFFYLLGMAASIVNAGRTRAFAFAVLMQRVAFLVLLWPVGYYLPRCRAFVAALTVQQGVVLTCLILTMASPLAGRHYFLPLLALVELFAEFAFVRVLTGEQLVPIDIEHAKERLGVLLLVMLGETVISSTMTYRKVMAHSEDEDSYYTVLACSFLLIFMLTLLFFNVQPAPKDHAFRRSRTIGCLLLVLYKLSGLALLAIGAYVKLTVEAVAEKSELCVFTSELLGLAVGAALILLLCIRLCHYGGKIPSAAQPLLIQRLFAAWWVVMVVFAIVPFVFLRATRRPIPTLSFYSGLVLLLVVVESSFTHYLEAYLPSEESAPLHETHYASYHHPESPTIPLN